MSQACATALSQTHSRALGLGDNTSTFATTFDNYTNIWRLNHYNKE